MDWSTLPRRLRRPPPPSSKRPARPPCCGEGSSSRPAGLPWRRPSLDRLGEQIFISSLALLKMLKHGRAGVPMEVMGLMLGEFIDDYTVRRVDARRRPAPRGLRAADDYTV